MSSAKEYIARVQLSVSTKAQDSVSNILLSLHGPIRSFVKTIVIYILDGYGHQKWNYKYDFETCF